ncbi:MAG: HAD-IA family hydrolase [Blastocatellia bacterium]|nr:HAD-IA family hydrolase [Blastocatellia bacterium]
MNKVQVVFFDAGGTLFEVKGSVGEIYGRFARRYGVERDPDVLTDNFTRSFRSQPPLAFPPGIPELHRLEWKWWRQVVLDAVSYFPGFDDYFDEVYQFFRGREAWTMFDDVIPTLSALKAQGLRLAIVSNYDSRIDDLLCAFEIEGLFAGVHISSRIGAAKPDAAIFRAALSYHQVEPEETIHVGDSLREDIEGAAAAGVRAVLLDRAGRFGMNDALIRISRLDELIGARKG